MSSTDQAPPEPFDQFVRRTWAPLVRHAALLTGRHADAEDLVQAALEKVAPRWRRLDGDPEAYVRRTMINLNISRWRRHRGREVLRSDPHDRRDVAEPRTAGPEERGWDIAIALDALTAKQRTVLVLRFIEDRTERETAALMGVRLGTVKSATRDALAAVRRVAPHLLDGSTVRTN